MNAKAWTCLVAVGMLTLCGGVSAQRGGRGGGRGMSFERPDTPTKFDSDELALKFDVPPGLQLFTIAAPGRYRDLLKDGRFLYLANPDMRHANVVAKYSANTTEADLEKYKGILETNPPQARLEKFKKRSVRFVKIGKGAGKEALEFVYDAVQNGMPVTVRQVVFVQKDKGFTFTCTSMEAEYGGADKTMFDPLFTALEFK